MCFLSFSTNLKQKTQAFGNAQMYLTPFMYDPSAPLNYGEERFGGGGET